MKTLSIIVLIPHFNNLEGLYKSLESISNIEPVDLLIIDDGSRDSEKPDQEYLEKTYHNINNIIYLNNDANRGIEYVLNDGLKYAEQNNYTYIARLDCGDICHPDRFMLQKEFLREHDNHYLVGSWVSFVDMNNNEIFQFQPKPTHQEIVKEMPIANQFCHPAIMFKVEAINDIGYYPLDRKAAEDYAYFYQFVQKFKTANIAKVLLDCEINPNGISLKSRKKQIKSRIKIILDNFKHNPNTYYGLIRNIVIYIIPYKFIEFLKRYR